MRFAYFDESGIGDAKVEPFVVVAGVIVDADRQIKAIEQYLHDMISDHVHPLLQRFTYFHAQELFNGRKRFDRNTYPQELRWKILREICEIPRNFDLPVVMGFVQRDQYASAPNRSAWKENQLTAGAQFAASTCCLLAVERYMRRLGENEVAALVYENNEKVKTRIRDAQRMLRDPGFAKYFADGFLGAQSEPCLPLSRIVETPLFAEKNESCILQVADAMAWAVNRKLRNADECDRFFEPIDKQLINARTFI